MKKIVGKKIVGILVALFLCAVSQAAFAQGSSMYFNLAGATLNGSGCPWGSYTITATPDGTTVSITFSQFTAQTSGSSTFDFANCNVRLPLVIPQGVTAGLIGVDYRGIKNIPRGSMGVLTREYFFAGDQGPTRTNYLYSTGLFTYSDSLGVLAWSPCGPTQEIASSNATIYVQGRNATVSVFSEDWDVSVVFHFEWGWC